MLIVCNGVSLVLCIIITMLPGVPSDVATTGRLLSRAFLAVHVSIQHFPSFFYLSSCEVGVLRILPTFGYTNLKKTTPSYDLLRIYMGEGGPTGSPGWQMLYHHLGDIGEIPLHTLLLVLSS
jgi:hypothetical protein